MSKPRELDLEQVETVLRERLELYGSEVILEELKHLQTTVYVMCGGGWLGATAASQPDAFYVDSRNGRLPYSSKEIEQSVSVLELYLKVLGIKPPRQVLPHNCGIF